MKPRKIFAALASVFIIGTCAQAYDIVNLPETLSFSEALGIYELSQISSGRITKLEDCMSVDLTSAQINELWSSCADMPLFRTVTPHPFSGIAVELVTSDGENHTFYLGSGVQIGKYGASSYMCYSPSKLNETLIKLKTLYDESGSRYENVMFQINTANDFLKLPEEDWAQTAIKEAAANGLLPYRLTDKYSNNITREEFCVLIGTLIATANNYKDLSAYMDDNDTVYQKISFSDCEYADPAVGILYKMGIVNGKSDTTFEPYSPLTREEAAKILCEASLHISGGSSQLAYIDDQYPLTFADTSQISDWAEYYVKWASQKWIMNGNEYNEFLPKDYYTVDQAVITVNRVLKSVRNLK